jgi:intracellular sulfur oxidation DsrE/DsrF family protein
VRSVPPNPLVNGGTVVNIRFRSFWLLKPLLLATTSIFSTTITSDVIAQSNVVGPSLHVDIPTKLDKANVVIDVGHAVLNGDMPFALADVGFLAKNFQQWKTMGQIIMIFHGDAAYLILNDDTYDGNRHVATGNPHKAVLNALMASGVQLELCGATAKGNHWGNANLLPGVKVNVNAMVRLTQLEQEGYFMIYE